MIVRLLAASTVLGALSAAALAADLPNLKGPPVYAPPPVLSWTGFYVGANAGYGWGDASSIITGGDPSSQSFFSTSPINFPAMPFASSFRQSGFVGGGQIGYNQQVSSNWVAGIEADFDYARVAGGNSMVNFLNPAAFGSGFPFTTDTGRTLDWFGTIRGRVGFLATPSLLIYGTGGLAYGETSASANVLNTPLPRGSDIVVRGAGAFTFACATVTPGVPISCYSGSSSRTSVGWAAGAGLEYRVLTNVTLRLEYLHVDLGGQTVRLNSPPPSTPGVFANARFDPEVVDMVRAGINYQFDLNAPVVAKY